MDSRNVWKWMRVLAVVAAFGAVFGATPARADDPQCSFTMSNISFNSVDPASGQPARATGTFTYACTGDSREIIRICPSFGVNASPRFMTDGAGHKLLFDLYSDEGMATVWGTWFGKVQGPTIDLPLGRSERVMGSALVYGRIEPGQQGVPDGRYQLSEGGNNTSIDYGYASKGHCQAIMRSQFIRTPFTIYATVTNSGGGAAPAPQSQSAPPAAAGSLYWRAQNAPSAPGNGAIVGGPGDSPAPGSPMYVCRASVRGGTHPGKWVNGNCNVPFGNKEVVATSYEVAYGQAQWRPYMGNSPSLLQTGNEDDGTPLYSCRVQYKNHGYQPGKISLGYCHFPYNGKEMVEHGSFEALYSVGAGGSYAAVQGGGTIYPSGPPPQQRSSGGGFWSKMAANAQYQQAKQNGASADELEDIKQGAGVNNGVRDNTNENASVRSNSYNSNGDLPPCRSEDPNAHLENGKWIGPHCLTEPDDGHYVTDEEAKKQNADLRSQRNSVERQEARADFLETHSCMTNLGADKANELAADCEKVTDAPHQACNIQENTCDAIRKATQKGCWGRGAEGPDWCLTRYP